MSEDIDRTLDLPRTGFGFLHHHDENDQVIAVQALRVRAGLRRQRRRHHRPWPKLSLWFVDPEGMRIEVDWVRDPSLRDSIRRSRWTRRCTEAVSGGVMASVPMPGRTWGRG